MAYKTALIFGGTAGIGFETARLLLRDGYSEIGLIGRNAARGQAARDSLQSQYSKASIRFFQADVTEPAQVKQVFDITEDVFSGLDSVIASISPPVLPALLKDSDPADYQKLLNTALGGVMTICNLACQNMRKQAGGSLLAIASDAAKYPTPGETAIGAVMAGIVMFCRTVALEEKRNQIRVNCLTPSIVTGTPLYDSLMEDAFCKKLFSKAEEKADLGVVTSEEVAEMAAYLTSPKAAKVTGQVISINGGIST